MAKRAKQRGEKTKAIREYRDSHPGAKPKEIAEQLNLTGLSITPGYVSTILSNDKRSGKVGKRRRGRPRKDSVPVASKSVDKSASFENLLAVKKLIDKVGSVEAAQNAISQYSQLMA